MQYRFEDGVLLLWLAGHIDSLNAPGIEGGIREIREKTRPDSIILDCDQLEYISSAGLRIILRTKQEVDDTSLVNVHPDFYEILQTTGFTEMMEVRKAYRVVSIEGSELIGQGANGKVYRLDPENIIKVYTNTDSLPEIHHERELSRAAFVLGIPTAIPYDVVQIKEGGYGSIYELLNARTFVKVYNDGEKSLDELIRMSIDLLRLIHSKIVKQEFVPGIKDTALDWAMFLRDYLPAEQFEKLYALIEAVPEDMHMVHGDFHFKNIMYQDGEILLIDMDTLSHGHPIFELAAMYNSGCGYGAVDHSVSEQFIGLPYETSCSIWRRSLELYLGTRDEAVIREVENKAKIIGYARIMRRSIRRNGLNTESGRTQIAHARSMLDELLPRTDTLLF